MLGQGSHSYMSRIVGRYPADLLDLCRCCDCRIAHMQPEYIRDDSMVRFVGCRRLETTEESQILHLCRKAQFFEEFPDQRRLWRLLLLHLATGLHEGNSAALAHKQCLPVRAQHQSRRYAYRFCHDLIGFADEFQRS